jgi:hypothetical protein
MILAPCWIAAVSSGAGVLVSLIRTPPPKGPAHLLAFRAAFVLIGVILVLVALRNLAVALRFTPAGADRSAEFDVPVFQTDTSAPGVKAKP